MTFGAGLMLEEKASPVGVAETVKRLEAAAKEEGWSVIGVQQIEKSPTGANDRPQTPIMVEKITIVEAD